MPEDFRSPLSLLSPSVFLPFLSNQKAKAGRRLRANNKSLSRMFEDARATRGKHMLMAPGLEANTLLFFLFLFFLRLNFAPFNFDQPELPALKF